MDAGRLHILNQLHYFLNDASVPVITVDVRSNGEEKFVHTLAGQFMLGRATMRPTEKEEAAAAAAASLDRGEQVTGEKVFPRKVRVKVWKTHFNACTTIPLVEKLAGGGPLSLLGKARLKI